MGYLKDGFELKLAPGKEVSLPEIIYYDVENKKDLDAYKLHLYLAETHPGKEMPVIYNTWLYKFDRFTYEDIKNQIEKAKESGINVEIIIGDVEEQPIERPIINQEESYSGKEGRHSVLSGTGQRRSHQGLLRLS